jgi:hypothetical protein
MRSARVCFLLIAVGLAVTAGCVETPSRPLLSPWNDQASFGFTDRRVGPTRVDVTYTTPFERTSVDASRRGPAAERMNALAMDIAVWCAAEIARQEGFPAIGVTSRRLSTNVQVYDETPPPRFILAHPQGGVRISEYSRAETRTAWMQGKAALEVELKRAKGEGDYDVATTIDQMSKKYEGILAR